MTVRWDLLLIPSFLFTFILLSVSQTLFLEGSFYKDLGLGRTGDTLDLVNYVRVFTDGFYLTTLWITVKVSALATICTLVFSFPVAYVIARMRSSWGMILLSGIVVSTFITIVIKVFGIIIIFSADGWLNQFLMSTGITTEPYSIIGTQEGVVIGLMYFTLGFGVLTLYSVVQTIPTSLEEAAEIHGASRPRMFRRVILPLAMPGLVAGGLMVFNMCMGAFTSAALLGGGKVFTLPVLIQRTIMMEVKYSMAGTLAAVLLVAVILINVLSIILIRRMHFARGVLA
ncbi:MULTISPECIES: ABC transporter permease [unclassified Minwuia]|uniref:ABC transporter permease n=1 Tax=unclassified Minwuia TaxID=2618799 RepID=UPI0024790896|nr:MULTISPECIES: ABC transporter permease [unclassified Minwuia]MDF1732006.1 ABC transporter permease [Minwuia sp.]